VGGLALTFAVETVKHLLYGVAPLDPATVLAVGGVLLFVALAAAFVPAIRAASVDPIEALRAE
jgi:putative ABC transport system permease protein